MSLLDDAWTAGEDAAETWEEWNNPEELEGAVGQRDLGEDAEQMLVEQYHWSEEDADDAVADNTVESVKDSWDGLGMAADDAGDAASAAADAATDPTSLLPWYWKYAAASGVVLVLFVLLAPYAELGVEVAG